MNCQQLPKNTWMASVVFGQCGSWLWDVAYFITRRKGHAVPVSQALSSHTWISPLESTERREWWGEAEGQSWRLFPLPGYCCFSCPGCQTCSMTNLGGGPEEKTACISFFIFQTLFYPSIGVFTSLCSPQLLLQEISVCRRWRRLIPDALSFSLSCPLVLL